MEPLTSYLTGSMKAPHHSTLKGELSAPTYKDNYNHVYTGEGGNSKQYKT